MALWWAKPAEHGAGTAELETGDTESSTPGCSSAAPSCRRRYSLGKVLDGLKTAGLEATPETNEAHLASQACLVIFALYMLFVGLIHCEQLLSDARFVTEAEEPRPHEPRSLRIVRVLDVLVVFSWAAVLIWLARELGYRRRSPGDARRAVVASMGVVAVVYFVGALSDYGQCQFQGGGIGTKCNGMACVQVACLLLMCVLIGHWNPRFLAFAVFTSSAVHNLQWASRESLRSTLRLFCGMIALCFVALPLCVYMQELTTTAQNLCVKRLHQETNARNGQAFRETGS